MTKTTYAAVAFAVAAALAGCGACGGRPAMPKGPPPEYEDPHTPSWLDAGAPAPEGSSAPSIAPAPAPDAG